jgi:hypothetical protein
MMSLSLSPKSHMPRRKIWVVLKKGNKIAHTFQKAFIQKRESYDIRSTKIFRIGIL